MVRRCGGWLGRFDGPVELRDARRFRWVTVGLTMTPVAINAALVWLMSLAEAMAGGSGARGVESALVNSLPGLVGWGGAVFYLTLFVYMLTECATWVVCPIKADRPTRRRQSAFGCYSSGPMSVIVVLTPLPFLVALGVMGVMGGGPRSAEAAGKSLVSCLGGIGLLALLPIGFWWQAVFRHKPSAAERGAIGTAVTVAALLIVSVVVLYIVMMSISAIDSLAHWVEDY